MSSFLCQIKNGDSREGQAMLLTVIALGGTLLGATTIAGLLMLYQIRQATDLKDSNKAIFAADAGMEMVSYYLSNATGGKVPVTPQYMVDSNGVTSSAIISQIICYSATSTDPTTIIPCSQGSSSAVVLRSYGEAGRANRAFQQ